MEIKTYKCKVSFDGWDWRNKVTVTSPKTNKTIYLTAYWGDNISESVKKFFSYMNSAWSEAKFGIGTQYTEYEFTKADLTELLNLSKNK